MKINKTLQGYKVRLNNGFICYCENIDQLRKVGVC